jgi:arsenate reductase-like glutaredoxin family protein
MYPLFMAIQIFGSTKCFNTKKAERFFKERNIPVQFINLKEKEISPGEMENIIKGLMKKTDSRLDAIEMLADTESKDYSHFAYLNDDDKLEKLILNPSLLKTPIVRNTTSKDVTVGDAQNIWKTWT